MQEQSATASSNPTIKAIEGTPYSIPPETKTLAWGDIREEGTSSSSGSWGYSTTPSASSRQGVVLNTSCSLPTPSQVGVSFDADRSTQTQYPVQGYASASLHAPSQLQRSVDGQPDKSRLPRNNAGTLGRASAITASAHNIAGTNSILYQELLSEAFEGVDWIYYQEQ